MNKYLLILVILCIILVILCIIKNKKKEKTHTEIEPFLMKDKFNEIIEEHNKGTNLVNNYRETTKIQTILDNINNFTEMNTYFGNSASKLDTYNYNELINTKDRAGWTHIYEHENMMFKHEVYSGILLKLLDIEATTVLDSHSKQDKGTHSYSGTGIRKLVRDYSQIRRGGWSKQTFKKLHDNRTKGALIKDITVTDLYDVNNKKEGTGIYNQNINDSFGITLYDSDYTINIKSLLEAEFLNFNAFFETDEDYITDISNFKFKIKGYSKKQNISIENIEALIRNKYNQLFGAYFKEYLGDSATNPQIGTKWHWFTWAAGFSRSNRQYWGTNSLMIYPDTAIFNHPEITNLLKYYVVNEFHNLTIDEIMSKLTTLLKPPSADNLINIETKYDNKDNWDIFPEEKNGIYYRTTAAGDHKFGKDPSNKRLVLNKPYQQINEWKIKRDYLKRDDKNKFSIRGKYNNPSYKNTGYRADYDYDSWRNSYIEEGSLRRYMKNSVSKFKDLKTVIFSILKEKKITVNLKINVRLDLNKFIESLDTYNKDDILIALKNSNGVDTILNSDAEKNKYDTIILTDGGTDVKQMKVIKTDTLILKNTVFRGGRPRNIYHQNKVLKINTKTMGFYTYHNPRTNTKNTYMLKFDSTYFSETDPSNPTAVEIQTDTDTDAPIYIKNKKKETTYKNIEIFCGYDVTPKYISIQDCAEKISKETGELEKYYNLKELFNYYEDGILYKTDDNPLKLMPLKVLKNYQIIEYLNTYPTDGNEIQKIIESTKTPEDFIRVKNSIETNLIKFYNKISDTTNDYTDGNILVTDKEDKGVTENTVKGVTANPTFKLDKTIFDLVIKDKTKKYTYLKYILQKYFYVKINDKGLELNSHFKNPDPLKQEDVKTIFNAYAVNISDNTKLKLEKHLILLDTNIMEDSPDHFNRKNLFTYKKDSSKKDSSINRYYIQNYNKEEEELPGADEKTGKYIHSVKNDKNQYIFFYTEGDDAFVLNKKHKFEKYNPDINFSNYEYLLNVISGNITDSNFKELKRLTETTVEYLKNNSNLYKRPIILIKNKTYIKSVIADGSFTVGEKPDDIDLSTIKNDELGGVYTNTEKGYHGLDKHYHPLYLKNDYLYCYYKNTKEVEVFTEDNNYDTKNLIRGFHCSEKTFNANEYANLLKDPRCNKLAKIKLHDETDTYPLIILNDSNDSTDSIVYVQNYKVHNTSGYSILHGTPTGKININYTNSTIPLKFYFKDIKNKKNLYLNENNKIELKNKLDSHAQYTYKINEASESLDDLPKIRTTLFIFKDSTDAAFSGISREFDPLNNLSLSAEKTTLDKYYTFKPDDKNVFIYNTLNNNDEDNTKKITITFPPKFNTSIQLVYSCTHSGVTHENIQIELKMSSLEAVDSGNTYLKECIENTNKLYYSLFNYTLNFLKDNLYNTLKERLKEKIDNIQNRDKNINKTIEDIDKNIKIINTKIKSYLDIINKKVQPIIRDILFKNYKIYNTRLTIIQIKENYQNKIRFRINLTRNDEYVKELHYLIIQTNLEILTLKQTLENKRQLSLEQLLETNAIIEVVNDKIKLIEEKLNSFEKRESFGVPPENIFKKYDKTDLSSITFNKTIPTQINEFKKTMKNIYGTLIKIKTTDSIIKEQIKYYNSIKNYLSFIQKFDSSIAFKSKIIEQQKTLFTIKVNIDNKHVKLNNDLEELKRLYNIDDLSTIDIQFDNVNKNILEMQLLELEQQKEFINQDIKTKNKTLKKRAEIQLTELKKIDDTIIKNGLMESNLYEGFTNKEVKEGFQSETKYLGENASVKNLINSSPNYQNVKNEFYKNIHSIESLNNNEHISIAPVEENNVYNVVVNDKCVTVYDDMKYDLKDCDLPFQSQFFEPILIKNDQDALRINKSESVNEDVTYPYYQMVSSVTGNCLTLDDEGMNLTPCNSNSITQHWKLNKNEKICIDN